MKIKKDSSKYQHALLLGANFLSVFGWSLLVPLYALFIGELGGNAQTAALIWALYTLLSGVLIIALGWLEDRLGHKEKFVVLGFILQTFGAGILFAANDTTSIIWALSVYALGSGFLMPAWKHTFAQIKTKRGQASVWGLFDGGNMLLISAAAVLCSALYGIGGFKGILVIMFAAHALATVLSWRFAVKAVRA